jgi:transcriptional regulator with XRE-family HTH domain
MPIHHIPLRMRPMIRAVGHRVRAHRLAQKMTQVSLGRTARVTHKFIGEVERGTANCSLVTLMFIAEGLGCTLTQLIQEERNEDYAMVSAEDMRRIEEAVDAIRSAITRRKVSARR